MRSRRRRDGERRDERRDATRRARAARRFKKVDRLLWSRREKTYVDTPKTRRPRRALRVVSFSVLVRRSPRPEASSSLPGRRLHGLGDAASLRPQTSARDVAHLRHHPPGEPGGVLLERGEPLWVGATTRRFPRSDEPLGGRRLRRPADAPAVAPARRRTVPLLGTPIGTPLARRVDGCGGGGDFFREAPLRVAPDPAPRDERDGSFPSSAMKFPRPRDLLAPPPRRSPPAPRPASASLRRDAPALAARARVRGAPLPPIGPVAFASRFQRRVDPPKPRGVR